LEPGVALPKAFSYYAPATLEEAVRLVSELGEQSKVIAGGQSLIPLMRFRISTPAALIDLSRGLMGELSYIRASSDGPTAIGALTTHRSLATSPQLARSVPMLSKAATLVGDLQVRTRGTIGGSLAHADPAAHYPPAVVALGASLVTQGKGGGRVIPADSFFQGPFSTALRPDEILTEIRVPSLVGSSWGYEALAGRGGSYASAIVAALVELDGLTCRSVRIVVGAATPSPIRLTEAEDVLLDAGVGESASKVAGDAAGRQLGTSAKSKYISTMVALLTRRAVASALGVE
jgi:carbon-monoxide dehydrogenase medium subunit